MLRFAKCATPLALMLVSGLCAQSVSPALPPLEPEWIVDLSRHGSRRSRDGHFGAPDNPGSVLSLACNQSVVAVTIDDNVEFFKVSTGALLGGKNLSFFPSLAIHGGFAKIFSTSGGHFLVDLTETNLQGPNRRTLMLIDGNGIVISSADLSNTAAGGFWRAANVSSTGNSFLLSRVFSGARQYQLRDSDTFSVRQWWSVEKEAPYWQSLSDDLLLSFEIDQQPRSQGNPAGKEGPIDIASPGAQPRRLPGVLAGAAAVLADDRILAIHLNELDADLVDASGRVLRTYDVPFSARHAYFQLASIAPDGRYFAARFLGQRNLFLPGREYLYLWSTDKSEPIALLRFKWNDYYGSESAFCSGDRTLAVINNARLELFDLSTADQPVRGSQ